MIQRHSIRISNLDTQPDRAKAVGHAIRTVTATGREAMVTIETFEPKRTHSQNAAWHASLGEWAQATGQDAVALKQRIKYEMGEYTTREIGGERFAVFNSSTRWSKAKFADAMLRTEAAAAAEGVVVGRATNWQDDAA